MDNEKVPNERSSEEEIKAFEPAGGQSGHLMWFWKKKELLELKASRKARIKHRFSKMFRHDRFLE